LADEHLTGEDGMRNIMVGLARSLGWLGVLFGAPLARAALAQTPVASTDSVDAGWPRQLRSGTTTFSIYQPQIDSWKGNRLAVRAAVAVRDSGAAEPAFGVIWLAARTDVDKTTRLVSLDDQQITKASFPSAPDSGAGWRARLQGLLPQVCDSIALDRLEAELAVNQEIQQASAQPLQNAPPRVIFSTVPAVLVPIDGQPVVRPAGDGVQRVINTRALLLQDGGTFYLHVFDGWMQATALTGPWTVATSPPAALASAMRAAVAAHEVDLLSGTSSDSTQADSMPAPSLAQDQGPAIYLSTTPTELIVTDGAPDYVPIDGTRLLYVQNTTGRVFKSTADNDTYVVISGRWYRAPSTEGPWTYVPGKELPADFARIPDSSPVENVKASVPGTPEAQEAAIANSIPQTAAVQRAGTTMDPAPTIDGETELRPIEGTGLRYVVNASPPIIEAGPTAFYSVENGVWFVAPSMGGPWSVAPSVPAAVYSIPPSSPLYYLTFVQVYGATPEVVYTGYTPGYYGTVLDPYGTVVYGTGYYYPPWIGTEWFGFPCTYGFGAGARWTPWTGWGFGFGLGWDWGAGLAWGSWGWGPHPSWGPYAWGWGPRFRGDFGFGRRGWAGTTGNVYARWDQAHLVGHAPTRVEAWGGGLRGAHVGVAYNSRTGIIQSGQRAAVRNVHSYTRAAIIRPSVPRAIERTASTAAPRAFHPAAPAPVVRFGGPTRESNDVFASPGGQVYRGSPAQGFEQRVGNGWQRAAAAPRPMLDHESQARTTGAQRTETFRAVGGFHGGPATPGSGEQRRPSPGARRATH
jgi:hypothetical protein